MAPLVNCIFITKKAGSRGNPRFIALIALSHSCWKGVYIPWPHIAAHSRRTEATGDDATTRRRDDREYIAAREVSRLFRKGVYEKNWQPA